MTNSTVVGKYEFTQGLESVRTIRDLIQEPAEYERWFGRYSSGIIFRLGFGKTIQTGQEPVVREVFHVVHNLERVASPGAYLVDVFPWMLSLPKFLAPWRRELEKLHEIELKLFRRLFNDVKMGMKTGTAPQCWERDFIQNSADYNLTEDEAAYVMGSLFEAGSGMWVHLFPNSTFSEQFNFLIRSTNSNSCSILDSTSAVMMTILFSTVHHPEWLGRMQAEVDSVCGASRLPTMADVPNLPGMRAVVKEVMRWLPVTPGGVPHKSSKDDMYDGYFIPAGTNLHPVQWAIHRDPEIYPDPETFRPERWLDPSFPTYREPLTLHPHLHDYSAFGHGRRICPGQNIAERSLYLLTARLAWACDISPKKSDSGQPILPRFDNFTSGLAVQPRWFPFDLNPRDSGRIKVLDAEILRNAENDPLKGQL